MRSGGRRASATAATSAPAGVGGFAAAPGAGPVPSGGGCRLGDDPPGHAEAAAAAARDLNKSLEWCFLTDGELLPSRSLQPGQGVR